MTTKDQNNQGGAQQQLKKEETSLVAILSDGDKGKLTYNVNGQDVALSYRIVRQFLTRGEGGVTDAEIVQFISLCKFNQLNPFLGEAYLVKYGNSPASMITSKEALMKRAESSEQYDGFQAGVIVMRNNEPVEVEGSFILPTDQLLGGWCKVFRKDRKVPVVSRVSFQEFSKNQSTWKTMPATMIRKVAEAQAFREAFPVNLGGMYIAEEQATDVQVQNQPGDDGGAAAAAAVEIEMKGAGNQGSQPLTFAAPAAKEATSAPAAAEPAHTSDGGDHNPGF